MPTSRPRHQVTETEALARALEIAEQEWPGEPRSRLIERLARVGAAHVGAEHAARQARRMATLDEMANRLAGTWPPNYLDDLREDWPA